MKPKLYYSIRGQAVVGPEHREEWKEQLPNYMKSSQSNGKDIEEAINIMEQLNKGVSCQNIKHLYGREELGDSGYALTLSLTSAYNERGNEFKDFAMGKQFAPDIIQKSADYVVSRDKLIAETQSKGAEFIVPHKMSAWNDFVAKDYSHGEIFSGTHSDAVLDILSSLKENKTWDEIREPFSIQFDREWSRAEIGQTIEQVTNFKGVASYLTYGGVEPQLVRNQEEYKQYLTEAGQAILSPDKHNEWAQFVTEDFNYHCEGSNAQRILDTIRSIDYFEDLSIAKDIYNNIQFGGGWDLYVADQTEKFSKIEGLADYFVKNGPQPQMNARELSSLDSRNDIDAPTIGDR